MTEDYRYCPVCGGDLETRHHDDRERLVCSRCGYVFYQNPAPAAGVVVVDDGGRLLWVQRKFDPRKGLWTLPAGFVEFDEHVEECAVRETKEETGLEVELTGLFNAYMAMDDPRTPVVLLLYRARVTGGELCAGDDAVAVRWVDVDEAPGEIAFRAHQLALDDIRRDRGA
jgi:ADP-ribose pyrophosphatase YjhB (NUDIX family)